MVRFRIRCGVCHAKSALAAPIRYDLGCAQRQEARRCPSRQFRCAVDFSKRHHCFSFRFHCTDERVILNFVLMKRNAPQDLHSRPGSTVKAMGNIRFLVSLITNDNEYQEEQANAAEELGRRLGTGVQVVYADNDAINQSQQLLSVIQSSGDRPDGIIVEPVGGTGLPLVARAAVSAGIGWAVLNREADYINDLRKTSKVPVFGVSANHLEVGRIQGQQLAAFVPKGGTAIYIQGPATTAAARYRTLGIEQTRPANIKLINLKGDWTEQSAHKATCSWMKLSTSRRASLDMVIAQNDDMAMGARRAFQERAHPDAREKWLALPFAGCDGTPDAGQAFVQRGLLAATVVIPPNTSVAMEILLESLRTGKQPPDLVLTTPTSYPPVEKLRPRAAVPVVRPHYSTQGKDAEPISITEKP
jgi:ribose transport system substrate-binding protein